MIFSPIEAQSLFQLVCFQENIHLCLCTRLYKLKLHNFLDEYHLCYFFTLRLRNQAKRTLK